MSAEDASIEKLSLQYCVSREVILRRFLDRGRVSQEIYEAKTAHWNEEYLASKGEGDDKGKRGDYYITKFAYLGRKYTEAAFGMYYRRAISEYELADYLDIKVRSIRGLEDKVREGGR